MAWLSTSFAIRGSIARAGAVTRPHAFKWFDGTLYLRKSGVIEKRLLPMPILYEHQLFGAHDRSEIPPRERIARALESVPQDAPIICLDVEHWDLQQPRAQVAANESRHIALLESVRALRPQAQYGYYGAPPVREYWPALRPADDPDHQAWLAQNAAIGRLAAAVDVLFPSIYAFYRDSAGWVRYAVAQIAAARAYRPSKPVYAFLWNEYHNSNRLLHGTSIEPAFWRLQLETVREHADGAVIWGGYDTKANRQLTFDADAPWWRELDAFLQGE